MGNHRADPLALRRGVLAVSVLDDIRLEPGEDGVRLGSDWDEPRWTTVPWSALGQALAGADPESTAGRLRLRDWLRACALASREGLDLRSRVLPLALPVAHALHPGSEWVQESVLGGVLDIGLAVRVTDTTSGVESTLVLSPGAAACAGVDVQSWWAPARDRLDALALLAVERLSRDATDRLTPMGGCDVLTLLCSRPLREYLAACDGTGLRAVAAPMRNRGWSDLARIDPAFVAAAAAATDDEHRGVARPLLVTVDEVTVAASTSPARLAQMALRDPAALRPARPEAQYR